MMTTAVRDLDPARAPDAIRQTRLIRLTHLLRLLRLLHQIRLMRLPPFHRSGLRAPRGIRRRRDQ